MLADALVRVLVLGSKEIEEEPLSDAFVDSATVQQTLADEAGGSRFVRACLRLPVDRTPVWFLRQAGRYMPEYMAVRKHHSLLEICRTPEIAAEVTITAAERLGVDAAIIFADLLLPFTPMGLDFEFVAGEGPVVHTPVRSLEQVQALRTDRTDELSYVARAIREGGDALFRAAGGRGHAGNHWVLRRSLDAGGIHDRRRQTERRRSQLHRDEEADVLEWSGLVAADGEDCDRSGCVCAAAGGGWSGRDPGLR